MLPKYVNSQVYLDEHLGPVHISVNANARRFIARWKNGEVHITIPERTTLQEYRRALNELAPKILAMKPVRGQQFCEGYHLEFDLWKVSIVRDPHLASQHIRSATKRDNYELCEFYVLVAEDWNFAESQSDSLIKNHINRIAAFVTQKYVLAEARAVADELGLSGKVAQWAVGRGDRRLGCCSADGKISLSRKLAFMPPHLRRHIITHELAHLSHHDHSPQFHALWQSYDGPTHTNLRKALKQFKFPF